MILVFWLPLWYLFLNGFRAVQLVPDLLKSLKDCLFWGSYNHLKTFPVPAPDTPCHWVAASLASVLLLLFWFFCLFLFWFFEIRFLCVTLVILALTL